ncbi:MAG: hypothetical protein Kow00127_03080 [Bacteroidales bacterium]
MALLRADRREKAILLFFSFFVILYHITGYIGHYCYDDMTYALNAYHVIHGGIDYQDHFFYRWIPVIPVAVSYWLFGLNDFASAIPALLATFAILFLVYRVFQNEDEHTLTIGLALVVLNNWFVFYSDKLMPDIHVALSVLATICFYDKTKFGNEKTGLKIPLLFVFSLFYGFLSKGTIVLILPLLFYLFAFDLVKKRMLKFWTISLVSGATLLVF